MNWLWAEGGRRTAALFLKAVKRVDRVSHVTSHRFLPELVCSTPQDFINLHSIIYR